MKQTQRNFYKNNTLAFRLLVLLFLLSLSLFALLAHEVVVEEEDWFDTRAFHFLQSSLPPGMISVFKVITFFGSSSFLLPAWLILIGLIFIKQRRKEAIDIGLLAISSTVLMHGFKALFARRRPELPLFDELTNYSFPSGHALSSLVFCFAIIWLVWRSTCRTRWKWLFTILLMVFSLAIGISRIVLRYHYASDVVGGFSLGTAFLIIFFGLRERIRNPKTSG